MATGPVLIDKLLNTVVTLKASDLHISVGQPPVVRKDGRLRRLDTKTLEADDTTVIWLDPGVGLHIISSP